MKFKICPSCGSKLVQIDKNYICNDVKCGTVIIDNHILSMNEIANVIEDISMVSKRKVIEVLSKHDMEAYAMEEHKQSSIVISISSINNNRAFIVPNKFNNIKEVLWVEFNDTDLQDNVSGGIGNKEAQGIALFIKMFENDDTVNKIIIQCEAGQSRSAGVAGAIMKYMYDDDTPIFSNNKYTPNMLCYRKVLNCLME